MIRDGFRDIVSGWTLLSGMADISDRIEGISEWMKANGPLEPDEEATIKLMIKAQIARGGCHGDGSAFDDGADFDDEDSDDWPDDEFYEDPPLYPPGALATMTIEELEAEGGRQSARQGHLGDAENINNRLVEETEMRCRLVEAEIKRRKEQRALGEVLSDALAKPTD